MRCCGSVMVHVARMVREDLEACRRHLTASLSVCELEHTFGELFVSHPMHAAQISAFRGLQEGGQESCALDLFLDPNDAKLSVVGKATVHLTGYFESAESEDEDRRVLAAALAYTRRYTLLRSGAFFMTQRSGRGSQKIAVSALLAFALVGTRAHALRITLCVAQEADRP